MVRARADDVDKIRGLGFGADDYIEKPFSPSVLVARVKANLSQYRRLKPQPAKSAIVEAGPLRIGPAYPFIFHPVLYPHTEQKMSFPTTPQSSVGARWLHAFYQPEHVYGHTNCGRRIHEDVRIMSSAVDGIRIAEAMLRK